MEALKRIQQSLKAPKGQFNSFGKYHYRSCEDILEAVKPLLGDAVLTLDDEMVEIGSRIYVKATATIIEGNTPIRVSAYAREPESRKGMDDAQCTGSTSSYARKYALNGLFCIDDCKDPDTQKPQDKKPAPAAPKVPPQTDGIEDAFKKMVAEENAPADEVQNYVVKLAAGNGGNTLKIMERALGNRAGFMKQFNAHMDSLEKSV